jgi:hypothetical protein
MSKLYLPTLADREQRDNDRQEAWDKRIEALSSLGDTRSDEARRRFAASSIVDARIAHTMKGEEFRSDATLDDIHDQCMEDARRDRIDDMRLEAMESGDA